MFSISKLSPDSQVTINYLTSGIRGRSLLTSIAIAAAVARTLSLPSSPLEGEESSVYSFYNLTHQTNVRNVVSKLNELVILDTSTILEYVQRIYSSRYNVLYPRKEVFCLNPETVVQDFFGISTAMDEAAIQQMKAAPHELTKITNSITRILGELNEIEASERV